MKVLIVDDSAIDRMLLRLNLEKHGCREVIEASDGMEGYKKAVAEKPDLIVSDALMPGVDGFELLRMIKTNSELKKTPFVFHSAIYTGMKERELGLSMGAEAFIAKPKEPEELWEELGAIFRSCESRRDQPPIAEPMEEETEFLMRYSGVVAAKLEEKVRELEKTLEERKRAEEALKASETRYRRLFEASKDGIIILRGDTCRIIDVNPSLIHLLEYPPEEYLGKTLCDTTPFRESGEHRHIFCNLQSRDYLRCNDISLKTLSGATVEVEFISSTYEIDGESVIQCNIRDISERKRAETALRDSELQRLSLQAEISCAAQVQTKLLPVTYPEIPNFEFAARCISAQQVGGDFYDWLEVAPGTFAVTLGDVMGKGMSAAMLMTTARSALHAAALQNRPAAAVQLAERALRADLESSESFVTLFHAHLDVHRRTLAYVDCGHGYVFLLRADGTVSDLQPRGLPLGVPNGEPYQEGVLTFSDGDALVLYSDGLTDARPELALTNRTLGERLGGAGSAREMMEALLEIPRLDGAPADDLTVLVIRCNCDTANSTKGDGGR